LVLFQKPATSWEALCLLLLAFSLFYTLIPFLRKNLPSRVTKSKVWDLDFFLSYTLSKAIAECYFRPPWQGPVSSARGSGARAKDALLARERVGTIQAHFIWRVAQSSSCRWFQPLDSFFKLRSSYL
jgi:hypothetical protein